MKPLSREGSRDRGPVIQQKNAPQKDILDKNKRNSNVMSNNHRDKNSGPELKDKTFKVDNVNSAGPMTSVGSMGSLASLTNQKQVSGIPSHMTKSMSTSALPVKHDTPPVIKPLIVPKPRSPTPPEDSSLPTRYLDITQFQAPEDMDGNDDHHNHHAEAPVSNPNPDMNQLTLMLQQGMSIAEVAKSMNIKLDEQTRELLNTLKQQLDIATALAKQSAINQGSTVPVSDSSGLGKTYDYSNSSNSSANYVGPGGGENSVDVGEMNPAMQATGDNSGVQIALNQMLNKQGQGMTDYHSQDRAYTQARDSNESVYYNDSRDPYPQYDHGTRDTSVGDALDTNRTDQAVKEFNAYGSDSQNRTDISEPTTYGEFNHDSIISSGLNSEVHPVGFNRYGNAEPRSSSVQKQYSYGTDNYENEGAQKISSHRNTSSSNYSGGSSGPPSLLGSPPFRNSGDGSIATGSVSAPNQAFGRQLSDDGKFIRGPYGNKPQLFKGGQSFSRGAGGPRPLMPFDSGRGRGRGDYRGYREKW